MLQNLRVNTPTTLRLGITHEFVIDFSQFYPESEEVEVCARIITPPVYAKTLLETLRGAIEYYEQTFGVIPSEDDKRGR